MFAQRVPFKPNNARQGSPSGPPAPWLRFAVHKTQQSYTHLDGTEDAGELRFSFGPQVGQKFPQEFFVVPALLHGLVPVNHVGWWWSGHDVFGFCCWV